VWWANVDRELGVLAARCGHLMPLEAGIDPEPRGPLCPGCARVLGPQVSVGIERGGRDAR